MQATGVEAGCQMNIKPSITLLVCEIGIWHPNIHLPLSVRREAMARAKELTKNDEWSTAKKKTRPSPSKFEASTSNDRLTVPNKITSRQQQPETPNDPYLSNKASCHQCQWAEHAEQSKNHKPNHKIKE
ncbi:hypothetical protein D5086_019787 [Populus alba]|uniref:Uncharacterized protein n=1 Tax=Populus alba TaxID=43335 RepID=A0ACC4BJT2_POPAL